MAERRSMVRALRPEEEAFLKGGSPKPPDTRPETRDIAEPAIEAHLPSAKERVTMTVRLEAKLFEALSRASVERKINRLAPYAKQDMVEDALKEWLQKVGYWPEE